MTSGKPKQVSAKTTADADAVSAVLYPAAKATTWGELVYESLYEFEDYGVVICDPFRERIYASTDDTTIPLWRAVVEAHASIVTEFTPYERRYSTFYRWRTSDTSTGSFWWTLLQDMNVTPRTLGDTIDRLINLSNRFNRFPVFFADQFDGKLKILDLVDAEAFSDALDAVVTSGRTMCFTLERRKGDMLPFEGGPI